MHRILFTSLIPKTILWSRRSFIPILWKREVAKYARITCLLSRRKNGYSSWETGSCIDKYIAVFNVYKQLLFYTQPEQQDSPHLLIFHPNIAGDPPYRHVQILGVPARAQERKWSALPGQRKVSKEVSWWLWTLRIRPAPCTRDGETLNRKQPHCQLTHTQTKHTQKNLQFDVAALWLGSWGPPCFSFWVVF